MAKAKKSITKRWIINNLGLVCLAILVVEMVFIYAIQYYYYSSAKQYLNSRIKQRPEIPGETGTHMP